jgi:glutathione S-transferase
MATGRLVIGNRRYSSWSMRGWLLVKLAGLEVTETVVPLVGGATPALKGGATPAGLVPFLEHDGARIWESLAIAEYCAEYEPTLWPVDPVARAHARSISAEMHAGFADLRREMPMNLCRTTPGRGDTTASLGDIARIEAIWAEARDKWGAGGAFLYGATFGAADAMFAPVVTRFLTYEPEISAQSAAYCAAVRSYPLVEAWYQAAKDEPTAWQIEKYEK